jgi:hypothetical protein
LLWERFGTPIFSIILLLFQVLFPKRFSPLFLEQAQQNNPPIPKKRDCFTLFFSHCERSEAVSRFRVFNRKILKPHRGKERLLHQTKYEVRNNRLGVKSGTALPKGKTRLAATGRGFSSFLKGVWGFPQRRKAKRFPSFQGFQGGVPKRIRGAQVLGKFPGMFFSKTIEKLIERGGEVWVKSKKRTGEVGKRWRGRKIT